MINQREKGKRYERDIAKKINKALGTNLRRTPLSGGLNRKGDILEIDPDSPAYPYHWELKNQKALHIPKWWDQTTSDCPSSKIPVLVYKMRQEDMVSITLNDFLGLILDTNNEENNDK